MGASLPQDDLRQSSVSQVQSGTSKQALVASIPAMPKNGYIYIYLSNESPQNVFFDKLNVQHITGPILDETHYYPFGLTMAGISDQAWGKPENRFKYNGIELNHKEFSDRSGLDLYTAQFRGLDPQIGRWWQVDPKPTYDISPYSTMNNNPILHSDFLGDTIINKDHTIVWSKDASKDIQTIGNSMVKTEVGRKILNAMSDAKYGIKMQINKTDIKYSKDGKLMNQRIKGSILVTGWTDVINKNGKINGATVTIYEKSLKMISNVAQNGGKVDKPILKSTVQISNFSINENIGANGVHEGNSCNR